MSRDALVVGINTYSYERLTALTAPAQDAEAICRTLMLSALRARQAKLSPLSYKTTANLTSSVYSV
jgi:hypothetical protein